MVIRCICSKFWRLLKVAWGLGWYPLQAPTLSTFSLWLKEWVVVCSEAESIVVLNVG